MFLYLKGDTAITNLRTETTNLNNYKKASTGFTIVELLIVIVVIGILAAITMVSYTGITSKANVANVQSDLANASKKLAMYYAEYGTYPTTAGLSSATDWCPTAPAADNDYCIKLGSNTTATYTSTSSSTYVLTSTNDSNNLTYKVTPVQAPTASVAGSDWVAVGNQLWAKANLNVGTRINGTVAQTNNGGTNVVEKYCYGDTDAGCTNTDANGIPYGGLYQWDEAMKYTNTEGAQGICPAGSHIPSDNEWKILEVQLGMTQAAADTTGLRGTDEGTKLKSSGSSGLNMPLAGYRNAGGSFYGLSSAAYLWSSSESGGSAWLRHLDTSQARVGRDTHPKAYGFSVRCLGN